MPPKRNRRQKTPKLIQVSSTRLAGWRSRDPGSWSQRASWTSWGSKDRDRDSDRT